MDGFCNQNADQLCYLAGPSLLTVYVGVVECASASPYTYSTHRFPDVREEDAGGREEGAHSTTPTYTVRRDGPAREPSLSAFWL